MPGRDPGIQFLDRRVEPGDDILRNTLTSSEPHAIGQP
jgi:hypothetical protein